MKHKCPNCGENAQVNNHKTHWPGVKKSHRVKVITCRACGWTSDGE